MKSESVNCHFLGSNVIVICLYLSFVIIGNSDWKSLLLLVLLWITPRPVCSLYAQSVVLLNTETWSKLFLVLFLEQKKPKTLRPGQKTIQANVFYAQGMWEQAVLWAREWRKHISTWGITRVRELYWQPLLRITNWRKRKRNSLP